jgi:ubiquinone/menaquinone biosynthesis C-methylase UbiE
MKKTGFNGTIDDVLNVWKRYALNWKKRNCPWRPSKEDINIYKKFVKEKLPNKILILGSTPELRNLVSDINNTVVLVDICPEMIMSMGKLLNLSKIKKEVHIVANWCSMPFPDSSFDIILSDCPWWLFSTSNQKVLVNEIYRVLKKDGFMVSRVHFCNTSHINKNLAELINENLPSKKISERKQNSLKETLMLRLLDATTNVQTRCFDTLKAIKIVESLVKNKKYNDFQKLFLINLLTSLQGRVDWSSQTREEILGVLSKKFIIENEISAKDYDDSIFFPILKLRKK